MESRVQVSEQNKRTGILGKLGDLIITLPDSKFLTELREYLEEGYGLNDAMKLSFAAELTYILTSIIKAPALNELRDLKNRLDVLQKTIDQFGFSPPNSELILNAKEQIITICFKAMEEDSKKITKLEAQLKISLEQLHIQVSKAKVLTSKAEMLASNGNEKDKVIGWLQVKLGESEQTVESYQTHSNSFWQKPENTGQDKTLEQDDAVLKFQNS